MEDIKGIDIEDMARAFHYMYEEEAVRVGWKTQKQCQVDFDDLPDHNRSTMILTCNRMLEWINDNQEELGELKEYNERK